MTVGKKIEELCKARRISPYKLFKAIGVTPSSAYRILKQKTINSNTLRLIADYFKVDVSTLLSDSDDVPVFNTAIYEHKVVDDSTELQKKIIELQNTIMVKSIEISSLRAEIASKEEIIKTKDQLIELLRRSIEDK